MPTSRKRIGFLPSAEVQDIIDKISVKNNLSQSKITGILVEEALNARNLYDLKNNKYFLETETKDNFSKTKNNGAIFNKNNDTSEYKEYELVKEYLNYKNFKKILSIIESE